MQSTHVIKISANQQNIVLSSTDGRFKANVDQLLEFLAGKINDPLKSKVQTILAYLRVQFHAKQYNFNFIRIVPPRK